MLTLTLQVAKILSRTFSNKTSFYKVQTLPKSTFRPVDESDALKKKVFEIKVLDKILTLGNVNVIILFLIPMTRTKKLKMPEVAAF